MAKKLIMLALAASAVAALAVPTGAGAATLTNSSGGLLPLGSEIDTTAQSELFMFWETFGTIGCHEVRFPSKVTKNNGTAVETVGTGGSMTCKVSLQNETVTDNNPTLNWIRTTTPGHGELSLSYELYIPGWAHCHYETAVPATFQYASGGNRIEISESEAAPLETSPAACGEAELWGSLELTGARLYSGPVFLN